MSVSRTYLGEGPSAAVVSEVILIKEVSGASDEEVKEALGEHQGGYEVRSYRT
jgi:hypothetical protein